MAFEQWTSADLYAVLRDDRGIVPQNFWRQAFFPNLHYSEKEEIAFAKVHQFYRVAPMVLPTEQGKPIYSRQGEKLESYTPAYIKPKDAVRPTEMLRARPSEVFANGGGLRTPAQRWDDAIIDITQFHRVAIESQWELMAARAAQYGYLDVRYRRDGVPTGSEPVVRIDFGRDPSLTKVLAPGANWEDPDHDILGDLQAWMDTLREVEFGAEAANVVLGKKVTGYFRRNVGLQKLLDRNIRGADDVVINRGLQRFNNPASPVTKIADISGLEIFTYTGQLRNDDGSLIELMDPKSVMMSAPGVDGVQCFGAIQDKKAGLLPLDIFGTMFDQDDPPATYIMHQSAPLMVPVNTNRTLTARVVA